MPFCTFTAPLHCALDGARRGVSQSSKADELHPGSAASRLSSDAELYHYCVYQNEDPSNALVSSERWEELVRQRGSSLPSTRPPLRH
eukprot:CAMPEP_0118932872 /NCGR_PEP_ID=MMETSP1169-20130426/10666_1 /TAXON_ID=36882 /ORGANISM="Pyramimonas obovata, Strain CCMP722" /LENGTH=86 /DNA_ID=CAMNT_0006875577 /DNA_START=379 /DNA_END=636 /DNA_ORIENTATION=-